jgi:AraC family transcriptional regulator
MNPGSSPPPTLHSVLAAAGDYHHALRGSGGSELQRLGPPAPGSGLCAALYASPAYDLAVPALALPRLSITLTAAPVHGALDGDRPRHWHTTRHALFLTPAGAAAHWRKGAPSRHINLYFDPAVLHDDAGAGGTAGPALLDQPVFNLRLPGLAALADALTAELSAPAHWATEATDSLGRLVLVRLARHGHSRSGGRNPLPAAVLKRVDDYVRAHLAQRIRVAELAQVAGLSPNHFAHAFSRVTGRSPHQSVLAARVAHAQALLQHSALPLSEVALSAGFASQQHLSRVLKQRTGRTPSQWRRQSL